MHDEAHILHGFDLLPELGKSKVSVPSSPSEAALTPSVNCSGRMPMPTRLERWMRSKLCATTAFTPSKPRAFGGPVARAAGAVLLSGKDHQRDPRPRIFHGGIVDGQDLPARLQLRHAALHARHHQVLDAHVGEGAAGHDRGRCRGGSRSC